MTYSYRRLEDNIRYDGNLRSAIDLASGKYCFLLGNDDALASTSVLEELHRQLFGAPSPGVVITNFAEYASGQVVRRVRQSRIAGSGPTVAAANFRDFSFVSGVLLDTAEAKKHATSAWDGSEYYQMFIGSRIIASGWPLLTLDMVTVRKDIKIPGEEVDSYRSKPVVNPRVIMERPINTVWIGPLVVDAVRPYVTSAKVPGVAAAIFLQLLLFTYPFWIFEYRRVHSWRYAAGVCLAMRPRRILAGQPLGWLRKAAISLVYSAVTTIGLLTPVMWFQKLYPSLHRLAKSFRGPARAGNAA